MSNSATNLLELPTEILKIIIGLVPDQLKVAQTCKKFYDISCQLKRYSITIRKSDSLTTGIDVEELEENESLSESILNSKRRIDTINLVDIDARSYRNLKSLFEKFRQNSSVLRLQESRVTKELFSGRGDLPGGSQLDLPNLKELSISHCPPEILKILNHLPDDVLTKVVVNKCDVNVDKFLRNQRNVKKLDWYESGPLAINLKNLQLVSLELDENCYSKELLIGQGSLTSLILNVNLEQADIDTISTLEHLEDLEFNIDQVVNLSSLRNLTRLKNLKVENLAQPNSQSIKTLQNSSVHSLDFSNINLDSDLVLTMNCPNVRNMYILGNDYQGRFDQLSVSSFLEKFPLLECLTLSLPPHFTVSSGFLHHNLKRIDLIFNPPPPGFENLLASCVNLETFKIHKIDGELLKTILTATPNLKVLTVEEIKFDQKLIDIFWELGKNLKMFIGSPLYQMKMGGSQHQTVVYRRR